MQAARSEGYNPLLWECRARGCFNLNCRPKVELFAKCFPSKCAMGDIDWEVELNGYHIRMEWKSRPTPMPIGQLRMFLSLLEVPNRKNTVLCIAGDPKRMIVTHTMLFREPEDMEGAEWEPHKLVWVEALFSRWARWALTRPRWKA